MPWIALYFRDSQQCHGARTHDASTRQSTVDTREPPPRGLVSSRRKPCSPVGLCSSQAGRASAMRRDSDKARKNLTRIGSYSDRWRRRPSSPGAQGAPPNPTVGSERCSIDLTLLVMVPAGGDEGAPRNTAALGARAPPPPIPRMKLQPHRNHGSDALDRSTPPRYTPRETYPRGSSANQHPTRSRRLRVAARRTAEGIMPEHHPDSRRRSRLRRDRDSQAKPQSPLRGADRLRSALISAGPPFWDGSPPGWIDRPRAISGARRCLRRCRAGHVRAITRRDSFLGLSARCTPFVRAFPPPASPLLPRWYIHPPEDHDRSWAAQQDTPHAMGLLYFSASSMAVGEPAYVRTARALSSCRIRR